MRPRAFLAAAAFLLLALGLCAPRATAGQNVVGLYAITATTDLGDHVRVTMQFTLINSGQEQVVISEARLRSLNGASAYQPMSLVLQPNSNSQVTQDFTITKGEYLAWKHTRPHLGLKVQMGGADATLTVPLFPKPVTR